MRRAISLAARGLGHVSPNPMVGCVIVLGDEVIGEGYHESFGGPHAEVNAIRAAEESGKSVEGATLYVNLEPCSHFGKTPPCAELLIEKRMGSVVASIEDPNGAVGGKGFERLRNAGVEVNVGLLKDEAAELNRFFIKHITTGMPWVTLKIGSSLDGRSATKSGESKWITSERSRKLVHEMRAQYDAVLVGKGTAEKDNPDLRPRLPKGRVPFRVVLDGQMLLRTDLKVFTDEDRTKTITASSVATPIEAAGRELLSRGVQLMQVEESEGGLDLEQVLRSLGERGIGSVLVEAGPTLAASFVRHGLFDELDLFLSPIVLGGDAQSAVKGLDIRRLADAEQLQLFSVERVPESDDIRIRYRKRK